MHYVHKERQSPAWHHWLFLVYLTVQKVPSHSIRKSIAYTITFISWVSWFTLTQSDLLSELDLTNGLSQSLQFISVSNEEKFWCSLAWLTNAPHLLIPHAKKAIQSNPLLYVSFRHLILNISELAWLKKSESDVTQMHLKKDKVEVRSSEFLKTVP